MITNRDIQNVRRILADTIGNPAKRAARERRNNALMVLIAQRHNTGTTTDEAETEFEAADVALRQLQGLPPRLLPYGRPKLSPSSTNH